MLFGHIDRLCAFLMLVLTDFGPFNATLQDRAHHDWSFQKIGLGQSLLIEYRQLGLKLLRLFEIDLLQIQNWQLLWFIHFTSWSCLIVGETLSDILLRATDPTLFRKFSSWKPGIESLLVSVMQERLLFIFTDLVKSMISRTSIAPPRRFAWGSHWV